VETKIYFKRGLKNVQFIEIAEAKAEAKLSGTGQIQLEMVSLRRNYGGSVNLWRFLCQEKRGKYYFVVNKRVIILGCRGEYILPLS